MARSHSRPPSGFSGAIPFAAIVVLWYSLTAMNFVDPVFLPGPGQTLRSFLKMLSGNFLREHLWPSALRVASAFGLSAAIAFPLGIWLGQSPIAGRVLHPILGFTRYLPVAALVPLCILWFGIDDPQKIAVIFLGVVFQLTLLLAASSASTPRELIEAGRTFGLSRIAILRRIVLPWALPAIWDDLRISAGWAWSYVVLAELVAGNRGVGYFVVQAQRYLETDRVFAGILFIGLLGAATDQLFRLSGRRLFRWV